MDESPNVVRASCSSANDAGADSLTAKAMPFEEKAPSDDEGVGKRTKSEVTGGGKECSMGSS